MRTIHAGVIVFAVFSAGALAPLRAQSLGDLAKKEEERRKTTQDSRKVYTNKDLGGHAATTEASGDASKAAPGADTAAVDGKPADGKDASEKPADGKEAAKPAAGDEKADADKKPAGARDQEYWSKRMGGLREQLNRDQVYADALQTRINALTTDFVNRDDPAQRAVIGTQRQTAQAELERLRKQIEADKKSIAEAEEEARRANVPPGWLR